jgi:hypothetical protein
MRTVAVLLVLAASLLPASGAAQPAISEAPDKVSVSIYRAPHRGADEKLELDWLRGYALVTETRTVAIPQGRAVIRFEGVAGGILPETAIVTGLPEGVREKNLDADLLSERSLYARSLGRPVTIRRVRDGRTIEERAVIRSGPDGAAIFETGQGFVVADCGQRDSIVYDRVPEGLSAKPTLSVETDSPRAGRATVTLSYLAWGFDWQANYVATMRPDGRSADLFAWVTLANGDVTGFADAETMVVAGKVNREDSDPPEAREPEPLVFRCLAYPEPQDAVIAQDIGALPAPEPAPAPAMRAALEEGADEIIVTGSKVQREDLGDLKLYRVPHPTTVAALSQKQVALLDRESVPVDVIYRSRIEDGSIRDADDLPWLMLRAQNREDRGLGLPLPQGPVAVFQPLGERRLLLGEGEIADKAVNEEVEVRLGPATQISVQLEESGSGDDWEEHALVVSNANPFPIRYEAELAVSDDYRRTRSSARLGRKNGRDVWAIEVPANGTARLVYRLKEQRNSD